jgi:hypothetical protein
VGQFEASHTDPRRVSLIRPLAPLISKLSKKAYPLNHDNLKNAQKRYATTLMRSSEKLANGPRPIQNDGKRLSRIWN